MPRRIDEWQGRIKSVEREHFAAQFALDHLRSVAAHNPTVLEQKLSLRDLNHAVERQEGTYVIRLFAEFEAGLREFWTASRNSDPPSRTRDLLNGIAANRRIPPDELAAAHLVREYRNNLVHELDAEISPIAIADARRALCKFFAFLPPNW